MKPDKEFEEDLEYLIQDWHWDKKSHEFARRMALFMYGFFEYLKSKNYQSQHNANTKVIASL